MRPTTIPLLILCILPSCLYGQLFWDLGYKVGVNATTSRTLKSDHNIWGYSNPSYPNAINNTFHVGVGNDKNRLLIEYAFGRLSIIEKIDNYADRHPKKSFLEPGEFNPDNTRVLMNSNNEVQLNRLSIHYNRVWMQSNAISHSSVVGLGVSWQREYFGYNLGVDWADTASNLNGSYVNEDIGYAANRIHEDIYAHLRSTNFYLTVGYELSYSFNDRWHWNTRLSYNQGLFKMIKWHTYRLYTESLTDYTEFDEQWSFTRLSYFALTTGVSFRFGAKNTKK